MAQRSILITSPYIRLLLKVLKEIVPDFNFYACMVPRDGSRTSPIYLFGATSCGMIRGGYELQTSVVTGDIYEDAVKVTRFFLQVQEHQTVIYHPPIMQKMWEGTWIHSKVFQQVWAER